MAPRRSVLLLFTSHSLRESSLGMIIKWLVGALLHLVDSFVALVLSCGILSCALPIGPATV